MTKITYTCDRCKKETDPSNLYKIALTGKPISSRHQFDLNSHGSDADWCADCLRSSGFFTFTPKELEATPGLVQPTIEDLITQIIQTVIDNQ